MTPRNAPAGDALARDIAAEAAMLHESRRRLRETIAVHDRRSGLLVGGALLAVMAAWIALDPPRSVPVVWLLACVAAHVVAGTVEFEIGPGCALPTTPVQVVMLFLLPPPLVPVAVVAGLIGSAWIARVRDPERRERPLVLVGSGWQAVGPAAVFAIAHVHGPRLSDGPVLALALLAQFVFDFAASWVRNCYGLGVRLDQLTSALAFTFCCDLFLAPLGLAAALAVPRSVGALVFLLPPTALLAMLQSDRRRQLDKTVALGTAFIDSRDLARRDALTGVANRLAFEEITVRYKQMDTPVGVILADVDGLKTANDTHGHAAGDQLLLAVTAVLMRASTWAPDAVVFRIGGDEFAILLPDHTPDTCADIGRRMHTAFRTAPYLHGVVPVSASIGVGFAPGGDELGAAIADADRGVHVDKDARGVRRR